MLLPMSRAQPHHVNNHGVEVKRIFVESRGFWQHKSNC